MVNVLFLLGTMDNVGMESNTFTYMGPLAFAKRPHIATRVSIVRHDGQYGCGKRHN